MFATNLDYSMCPYAEHFTWKHVSVIHALRSRFVRLVRATDSGHDLRACAVMRVKSSAGVLALLLVFIAISSNFFFFSSKQKKKARATHRLSNELRASGMLARRNTTAPHIHLHYNIGLYNTSTRLTRDLLKDMFASVMGNLIRRDPEACFRTPVGRR
jgi:hypothetical protein